MNHDDCYEESYATQTQIAFLANWFAGLFIAPLDSKAIAAYQKDSDGNFLNQIGLELNQEEVSKKINAFLFLESPSRVAIQLERDFVRLFEGVMGPKTISLYERTYDKPRITSQKTQSDMRKLLDKLQIEVNESYKEPCDHIAIELTAFATAIERGEVEISYLLWRRLISWIPKFKHKVVDADPEGFYGNVAKLLLSFLSSIQLPTKPIDYDYFKENQSDGFELA